MRLGGTQRGLERGELLTLLSKHAVLDLALHLHLAHRPLRRARLAAQPRELLGGALRHRQSLLARELELRADLAHVVTRALGRAPLGRVDPLHVCHVQCLGVQLVDVHDDLLVLELLGQHLVERVLVLDQLVDEAALGAELLLLEQVGLHDPVRVTVRVRVRGLG